MGESLIGVLVSPLHAPKKTTAPVLDRLPPQLACGALNASKSTVVDDSNPKFPRDVFNHFDAADAEPRVSRCGFKRAL